MYRISERSLPKRRHIYKPLGGSIHGSNEVVEESSVSTVRCTARICLVDSAIDSKSVSIVKMKIRYSDTGKIDE